MANNEIDPKLNEDQAAAHVGLAAPTLATLRCRGCGPPYFKLGRRVVYSRHDLDTWLCERRVRSTAEVPDPDDAASESAPAATGPSPRHTKKRGERATGDSEPLAHRRRRGPKGPR